MPSLPSYASFPCSITDDQIYITAARREIIIYCPWTELCIAILNIICEKGSAPGMRNAAA
jgi:hypothetical protein